MKSEFLLAFNQICSERGLPAEVVLDALRTALVSAYRRNANLGSAQNITAEIDQSSGQVQIFVEKEAVEEVSNEQTEALLEVAQKVDPEATLGDTVMIESTPKNFGRIAAQTAKQVILQRIREAEREVLYEDYAGREGEIINGMVQSVTGHQVSINLGRTEALLPRKEQIPGERFTLHQRVRAYVVEVRRSGRGPQIIVSRSHKNMLRRLLELEVPEIYNGAVEIKAIAREAGARSKVAVAALQPGVDPVGSCVGMRGVRIQSIVNELGGEKIDVIEWDPDQPTFIAKALSPAQVLTVHLDENPQNGRTAVVIVPDDQLSLAIGRAGQNARLAAKLTGWRIDIKSITEAAQEALSRTAEPEIKEEMGKLADLLPTAAAVLERHSKSSNGYSTEERLLLRRIVDGTHDYFVTQRQAEQEALAAEKDQLTDIEAEEAQRRAERQEALAEIPPEAYETSLEALGLSTRVYNHLDKADVENLGQILERMVEGDEGLLALDGIGPKSLAEIKERVEATTVAAAEEAEVEEERVEAAPEPEPEAPPVAKEEPVVEPVEEAVVEPEPETVQAEPVQEVEVVEKEVETAEPEVTEEPEVSEDQYRAKREKALAEIPADAYDLPLQVLALDSSIRRSLLEAGIENLGEVMEALIEGDERMLSLKGIDASALDQVKTQVEIMVSVPEQEPEEKEAESTKDSQAPSPPRYEYVTDDEFEEKSKTRRPKRRKKRHTGYGKELERWDSWEELEE